jgi:hypothetical protein
MLRKTQVYDCFPIIFNELMHYGIKKVEKINREGEFLLIIGKTEDKSRKTVQIYLPTCMRS